MKPSISNTQVGGRMHRLAVARGRLLAALGGGLPLGSVYAGQALAQTTGGGGGSPPGGLGEQVTKMSGEGLSTASFTASTVLYILAAVVFIGGAWALWKARQPQNRESGYLAMGVTGLVLCGLFAGGGAWVNKAAVTTSGTTTTVGTTPTALSFGGGGAPGP